MLSKEAIEQIQKTAGKPEIVAVGEFQYMMVPKHMSAQGIRPAMPNELQISTLRGLIDYLSKTENKANCMVHIKDYRTVDVISKLDPVHMTRKHFMRAVSYANAFKTDIFLEIEDFIISVMANFVDTPICDGLLTFVGSIRSGYNREDKDNGFTQSVTVKSGVTTVTEAQVPNPVPLQPFETFPEIGQPVRNYVFRIKKGKTDEDPVKCALFETASNVWKIKVHDDIRQYILNSCPDTFIIS